MSMLFVFHEREKSDRGLVKVEGECTVLCINVMELNECWGFSRYVVGKDR